MSLCPIGIDAPGEIISLSVKFTYFFDCTMAFIFSWKKIKETCVIPQQYKNLSLMCIKIWKKNFTVWILIIFTKTLGPYISSA